MKKYILLAVLLGGCATAPLTEDEQYERENRNILRREAILKQIHKCYACSDCVLIEKRTTGTRIRRATKRYRTIEDIPTWAHSTDYLCGNTRDVLRDLQRQGF